MSAEYVTQDEHNKLSEKVDEFTLSLAETKSDVKLSLSKHDEIRIFLKESFEKLDENLSKTRHDCRNLIFALEGRVRKLEDKDVYNKGLADGMTTAFEKREKSQDVRIDRLSKWSSIAFGAFGLAITILGFLHIKHFF